MKNPFKFGSVVEKPYFTNRVEEITKIKSFLNSENHLIIISPRRYGKTSLVNIVLKEVERPSFILDLQTITSPEDLAARLLKKIFKIFPKEKIINFIKNFRIIPSISVNPLTNEIEVNFITTGNKTEPLEDALELINKVATTRKRIIVVFDEFQEITRIGKNMDRTMRAIMQFHENINYIFLGSQESLIREIFEKKKSPFYHFGYLMTLQKIPLKEFRDYLKTGFRGNYKKPEIIADKILKITQSHPYYTQLLAYNVWEIINRDLKETDPVERAIEEIRNIHDNDYERIWNTLNSTDMKILIGIASEEKSLTSLNFLNTFNTGSASTTYSGIKRLMQKGFIIKSEKAYEFDDPFFKLWLINRRT